MPVDSPDRFLRRAFLVRSFSPYAYLLPPLRARLAPSPLHCAERAGITHCLYSLSSVFSSFLYTHECTCCFFKYIVCVWGILTVGAVFVRGADVQREDCSCGCELWLFYVARDFTVDFYIEVSCWWKDR